MLFLVRLHNHLRHLRRATEHMSLGDRNYKQVCLVPRFCCFVFFFNSCILNKLWLLIYSIITKWVRCCGGEAGSESMKQELARTYLTQTTAEIKNLNWSALHSTHSYTHTNKKPSTILSTVWLHVRRNSLMWTFVLCDLSKLRAVHPKHTSSPYVFSRILGLTFVKLHSFQLQTRKKLWTGAINSTVKVIAQRRGSVGILPFPRPHHWAKESHRFRNVEDALIERKGPVGRVNGPGRIDHNFSIFLKKEGFGNSYFSTFLTINITFITKWFC